MRDTKYNGNINHLLEQPLDMFPESCILVGLYENARQGGLKLQGKPLSSHKQIYWLAVASPGTAIAL